jgi:hypothetical protein
VDSHARHLEAFRREVTANGETVAFGSWGTSARRLRLPRACHSPPERHRVDRRTALSRTNTDTARTNTKTASTKEKAPRQLREELSHSRNGPCLFGRVRVSPVTRQVSANVRQCPRQSSRQAPRENVSHCLGSPDWNPRMNQCDRCCADPWVKVSGFTCPRVLA